MEGRTPSARGGANTGDIRGEEGEGAGLDEAARQPENQNQRGGHPGLKYFLLSEIFPFFLKYFFVSQIFSPGQQLQEAAGAGQETQSGLRSVLPQDQSSILPRSEIFIKCHLVEPIWAFNYFEV